MERFALDQGTADLLPSGALDPEALPPPLGGVASLRRIAAGPTSGAREGEGAAVAAVVEAIRSSPAPGPARRRAGAHTKVKVVAAAAVAVLTLTGSLAAADALPGPAQEVAADALDVVGVPVPNPARGPAARSTHRACVPAQLTATPT